MDVTETITCVDCGETAHLLSYERPDEPWAPGDIVSYRCSGCNERWDIEVAADEEDDPSKIDRFGV